MPHEENFVNTIPVGKLGIIAHKSSQALGEKVDQYIVNWRNKRENEAGSAIHFKDYRKDSYLLDSCCPRFGSGEAKAMLKETIRGDDLYILVDVCNYSLTYTVSGQVNHMSPDDHYQDLKRIIAAASGKARRITVIMPFLYESRQHKRSSRESLDCAIALQELVNMGVDSIITFDAHDPRVQNAIPFNSFETVQPAYQFIQLCEDAERNPKLSGFDIFENFINNKKAYSQGKSLPIHEQFDNLLKAYGQSIQGLTRCEIPYIEELLDRVRLLNGNVPILNVINSIQRFDISNIKALVSALGIPYMHAENRGWFFPSMNGNGASDIIRLVSLMMLFDFLTQEKTSIIGSCPLIKMCGNCGTYCYDKPWVETGCAFDLIGQEINLKSKTIKIR